MPRKPDADAGRVAVVLDGRRVELAVRRSDRARRLRLRVLPHEGLEVVLPRGATRAEALAFVRHQSAWVLRHATALPEAAVPFVPVDGATLPYLGRRLALRVVASGRVTLDGDILTVPASGGVAAIERWYRAEARRVGSELAARHAGSLGVSLGRLAIKDTRSRWGSCSSNGNLNLSWRLVMAPFEVLDYVVAHEVAHRREMNHSPRFWTLVEGLCPRYREHRRWLRSRGAELLAWPRIAV